VSIDPYLQRFAALSSLGCVLHAFTLRVEGIDVRSDRETALRALDSYHENARKEFAPRQVRLAEQVHGNKVAVVSSDSPPVSVAADAMVTIDRDIFLGIYVADCCALFLVDSEKKAIGLVHSGRKGTALDIAGETVRTMVDAFGTDPGDIVAQLSPCIRPPYYETDFAAEIREQLKWNGVHQVYDSGENTGSDLSRFYSYRMEKGRTGRMLGLLALR
jgi:polyphenol oxidase